MKQILVNCSICDEPQAIDFLERFGHTGFHDADLRPSGQAHWLWPGAVTRCVGCGACGETIDRFPRGVGLADYVRSPEYRAVADADQPATFRNAMAAGALAVRVGWSELAFQYYLAACWAADDETDRRAKVGLDDDLTLGASARSHAIDVWLQECGDIFAESLPRGREDAATSLLGEPLLDNQALVDVLRRNGDFARARAASVMARRALAETVAAWSPYGEGDEDVRAVNEACATLLDVEDALIRDRDAGSAQVRVELPLWWAE